MTYADSAPALGTSRTAYADGLPAPLQPAALGEFGATHIITVDNYRRTYHAVARTLTIHPAAVISDDIDYVRAALRAGAAA